jgi:hypothetical protein
MERRRQLKNCFPRIDRSEGFDRFLMKASTWTPGHLRPSRAKPWVGSNLEAPAAAQ